MRYIPGGGGDLSKLLTLLMAGGVGPDVSFFDQNISAYALKNLVVPLDPYIKKDGILPSDFWRPSWQECQWNGKTYALGWETVANFACLYNKRLFREAGLNPEAPATMSELDEISPKLTTKDANGVLKTASMIPWSVYGYGNSAYTWGWIFGGDFYDEATKKVTCAEPRIVASFKWMSEFLAESGGMSKFSYVEQRPVAQGFGVLPVLPRPHRHGLRTSR